MQVSLPLILIAGLIVRFAVSGHHLLGDILILLGAGLTGLFTIIFIAALVVGVTIIKKGRF